LRRLDEKTGEIVWSSAFTRFFARRAADRLKAELQPRTVSYAHDNPIFYRKELDLLL
jgi:hypothetical protein